MTTSRALRPSLALSLLLIANASAQLSGIRTIGGAAPDYPTFGAAIAALRSQGVNGPLTFEVRAGSYNEHVLIGRIPGASTTNRVTFAGVSAAQCTLWYAATGLADNYVVALDTTANVTMKNLTLRAAGTNYSAVVTLKNGARNIEFRGNTLIGYVNANGSYEPHAILYTYDQGVDSITIAENTFWYGGYAIYLSGSNSNPTVKDSIIDNTFILNQYVAIGMSYAFSPIISGNVVDSTRGYGINLRGSGGARIIDNELYSASTGISISSWDGFPSAHCLVANNVVAAHTSGIELVNSTFIDCAHNSVEIRGLGPTTSGALTITGGSYISVQNNILTVTNLGMALRVSATSGSVTADRNILYTPGIYLAEWRGPHYDLAELQDSTGTNLFSRSVDPWFTSRRDFTPRSPWTDGVAVPLAGIPTDLHGLTRDPSHPDPGALEFTPSPADTVKLAGTYIVGPGGEYPGPGDALADAMFRGISAPVTFSVLPGSYPVHSVVRHIPGTAHDRTVTVQSSTADTADVEFTYAAAGAADNYILFLHGADYLRVRNIAFRATGAYGCAVTIVGGTDGLVFDGNLFRGYWTNDGAPRGILFSADEWMGRTFSVLNNVFRVAGQGLYCTNTTSLTRSVQVAANRFEAIGYRAIWVRGTILAEVSANTVLPGPSRALEADDITGRLVCRSNILHGTQCGMMLNQVTAHPANPGLVANNAICVASATGTDGGGLRIGAVTNFSFYHNSISVLTSASSVEALRIENTGSGIDLRNNCVANFGHGGAYSVSSLTDPISRSDNNNWYSAGNFLGWQRTTPLRDLQDLQQVTGREGNSVSVPPCFASETDLHASSPWLDGKGAWIDSVTVDFDGEPRVGPTTTDIGADEFTSDPSLTPWAGILTVGPGGDLPDLSTAARQLPLRGVSGPLSLRLLDGTHPGGVTFLAAPNASHARPVTIESQSGNPRTAVISHGATSENDNFVLRLVGADYFRLRNLSLTATGTTHACVLRLWGGVEELEVTGSLLTGISPAPGGSDRKWGIVVADSSGHRSRFILGNQIRFGTIGISQDDYTYGLPYSAGLTIADNIVYGSRYCGVDVGAVSGPTIARNSVDSCDQGIVLQNTTGGLSVTGNSVDALGYYALSLIGCDGTTSMPSLIANNFLRASGLSNSYGIHIGGCDSAQVVHNSVLVTGTHANFGRAFDASGSSPGTRILNNIFANTGGGYAYYVTTPGDITLSDHNDFYATGSNLAYWGGVRTNLASLQGASGMDAHSLSQNPQFASADDLHTESTALNGAASPSPLVTEDFDRQRRNPVTPDIGADEYRLGPSTPPQLVAPIADVVYPEDSGEHLVADLRTVVVDTDPDDALAFSAGISSGPITILLRNDSLFVACPPNVHGSATAWVRGVDLDGYAVSDTFQVTYTTVNDPPIAADDQATTTVNTSVTIPVVRNDSDVDGHLVYIQAVGTPAEGGAVIEPGDTLITYTPATGFAGTDSMIYVATDRSGGIDTAMIRISVLSLFSEITVPFDSLSHCSAAWGDYDGDGDMDLAFAGLRSAPTSRRTMLYTAVPGGYNTSSLYPGMQMGKELGLAWTDLDGDGDLDLVGSGLANGSVFTTIHLYENQMGSFTDRPISIPPVWGGALAWGDYDNDGDADLAVSGSIETGNHLAAIYRNDGKNSSGGWDFADIAAGIPRIWQSSLAWGDFDRDRDLDLLISGVTSSGTIITRIYRNQAGLFEEVAVPLLPIYNGSVRWIDVDNDLDLDIVLAGDRDMFAPAFRIYRNDGGAFTEIPSTVRPVGSASMAWGDADGDGDADLLLAGRDTVGTPLTRLYMNAGGVIGDIYHEFRGVLTGSTALVDCDRDGDLDLFFAGYTEGGLREAHLFRNNAPVAPATLPPPVPFAFGNDSTSIRLYWHPVPPGSVSGQTLTYNLRIGTEPGLTDVVPSHSRDDGTRMLPAGGNMDHDTASVHHHLRRGKLYTYSLQTVDASHRGSAFSEERYFSIYHPVYEEGLSRLPNRFASECAIGDFNRDGKLDVALAGSAPTLGVGNADVFIRSYSGFAPEHEALPAVTMPALAWGDYDNDGDLDLAIAGALTGAGSITRIYRNTNNTLTDIGATLAGTHEGGLAWGDYDRDGDLDLAVTGNWVSRLYRNDRGSFVDAGGGFTGLLKSSVEWGDYDNDGDPDLLFTGRSQSAGPTVPNALLYRNDAGVFTLVNAGLRGVISGTGTFADMDNDGDLDILIAGDIGTVSAYVPYTGLFRNDGGTFTHVATDLDSVHQASAAWGDLNADGRIDLVLTGYTRRFEQAEPVTLIYRNTGAGFVPLDHPVVPVANGKVALGSWFTAGRLDLLVTGGYTKLYLNRMAGVNTAPSVPGGLRATLLGDTAVVFRWNRSTDAESPSAALTYNLRVGTTPGGCEVLSAMADTSGTRRLTGPGNVGGDTTHILRGLVRGRRYYWSVQGVDNGYVASAFSGERSFYASASVYARHRVGLALPIMDFQTTTDTMLVSVGTGGGSAAQSGVASSTWHVMNLAVIIDSLRHSSVGDLVLTLDHLGVTDTLVYHAGGDGDDMIETILEDGAAIPISAGTPPFTGTFRPSNPLAVFNGLDANGIWSLHVADGAAGETGVLRGWGLIIAYDLAIDVEDDDGRPTAFVLLPNYPNPFNPSTRIRFGIPRAEEVTVEIYTLLGQRVGEMRPGRLQSGFHNMVFDASSLASGVYLYRVRAGEWNGIGKMVLVR